MISWITTYVQEMAAIAAAISAFLAFCGLLYAGCQFKQNTKTIRQKMYLDSLDRYFELRKMLIDDSDLVTIYEESFDPTQLTGKQRYYIYCLIAFCEGLFLTEQIEAFGHVVGGSWQNFIKHTLSTPAVKRIWDGEVADPRKSDFADDFIAYATRLLDA